MRRFPRTWFARCLNGGSASAADPRTSLGAALLTLAIATAENAQSADAGGDASVRESNRCLYAPEFAAIDRIGCIRDTDSDNDGVNDDADNCPYSPAGAQIDVTGCAVDDDFDGVANGLDACPASDLGAVVDLRGCTSRQVASAPPKRAPVARTLPAAQAQPVIAAPPATASVLPAPAASAVADAQAAITPMATATVDRAPVMPMPASLPVIPVNPSALLTLSYAVQSNLVSASSMAKLRAAVPAMRQALRQRGAVLVVEGYADAETDGSRANTVARSRANQLRRLLINEGIDSSRIQSVGHAATDNGADQRRAEVIVEVD